jgi:Icc-related predicted phosphoesterase
MRIVCLSDTHLSHETVKIKVPDGDLLTHAGDGTLEGSVREIQDFIRWLKGLHHRHKILIAGNHDRLFEADPGLARSLLPRSITYLQDSAVEIEGLKIFGSPWQPEFQNWAFNLPRGPRLREKWRQIPEGLDILVTHGPPMGVLDQTPHGEHVGCADLREAVERVKPKVHVFGHIHHGHGMERIGTTTFVNASVWDESFEPNNPPLVVDL